MFKFLIGIVIGVMMTVFYPDIVPVVKNSFLDSGVRDVMVNTLTELKK
jgi:hypothetical protein